MGFATAPGPGPNVRGGAVGGSKAARELGAASLSGSVGLEVLEAVATGGVVGLRGAEGGEAVLEGDGEGVEVVEEALAGFVDVVVGLETFGVLLGAALAAFTNGVGAAFRGAVVFVEPEDLEVVVGFADAIGFALDDKAAACWRIGELVMFRGEEVSN